MDVKNKICLEYKKEDRIYKMEMDHNAPLSEAYEAACGFLDEIVKLIQQHAEKIKPQVVEDDEKCDEPA